MNECYVPGCKLNCRTPGITAQDYEEVLRDHKRLVREIDVIISGEHGAAKQASLVDLVGPIKDLVSELTELKIECKRLREYIVSRVDNA